LRLPVDVYADLNVDTSAGRIAVTADGRTVTVTTDRYGTYRQVGAPFLAADRTSRRRTLEYVRNVLAATDTDLKFRVRRREVAYINRSDRAGVLSRVLGLPGLRVRTIPFLRSLFGRR
jgi:hypothetical protein